MSTSKNKTLGKNFEYRVRNWLRERNWTATRVPVSGMAQDFKNDIYAHYQTTAMRIEIECKKTSKQAIRLFFKNIRKIDSTQDHYGRKMLIMVFALLKSDLYCIVPEYFCQVVFPPNRLRKIPFNYEGKESLVIKHDNLQQIFVDSMGWSVLAFTDKTTSKEYCIGLFEWVISQLEHQ